MSRNVERLYAMALTRAKDAAGGERAFWIIGARFRVALVAQEILTISAQQDETISADTVRAMTAALCDRLRDHEGLYE